MESAILSIYNKIKVSPLGKFIGRHPKKVIIVLIGTYLYIQRSRDRKKRIEQEKERKLLGLSESESHRKSLRINKQFYNQLSKILKIVLPGVRTKQFFILALHTFFLITRTYLSIVVARLDGSIVKNIVDRNLRGFLWRLALWLGIALPATYVNSMIRYLEGKLAIELRTKLVDYLYSLYMENDTYYKVENLDSRLKNADQGLTDDASRFCTNLAHLYSQLSKPILDICLMTVQLVLLAKKTTDGVSGKSGKGNDTAFYSASLAYAVITLTAQLLRSVSPPFGKLASQQAKLEGELRAAHSRVITNSEEIAFYGGHKVELSYLKKSYLNLIKHLNLILKSKIVYTMLEGFSMKYLWSATGLLMIAIPNFARNVEGDTQTSSQRTESYIYAKGLLINGADACERIMSSYKEITEFAGFTHRVYELIQVFEDISVDKYKKQMSSTANVNLMDSRGTVVEDNMVKFEGVPIVSPNGDVLIESMSFELKPGMHCLITGPNGCGKSSLFRILSGLWPVYKGKLTKPHRKDLFYIPQSAYLTVGTLRDQVLYPHCMSDLSRSEAESIDQRLTQILSWVDLTSIVEREENGFNAVRVWEDTLSGGEKQRLAMARLFYHKPLFAILDECTSAVSIDVEGKMYSKAKELGITLLTVSHRHTLWKYHNYLLQYDGCKNYSFSELNAEVRLSLREEKNQIEEQLQNVPSKQKRLKELCLLLGEDSRYVDNQPQSQVEIIENN